MAARTYPTTATGFRRCSFVGEPPGEALHDVLYCLCDPLNEADDARAGPKRFRQEHSNTGTAFPLRCRRRG